MMDRLDFGTLRETNEERYRKVELLEASIVDDENPERYLIRRSPESDTHVVEIVVAYSEPWGRCSCDGYKYHDGPCSHLSAVWRAQLADMLEIPTARPTGIHVDLHDPQQELADAVDHAAVATDGGRR